MNYREEQDSMGTVHVPEDAYYGAQTQRAVENFSISGLRLPPPFIKALGLIKKHNANEVIAGRANEILTGKRGGKSP
jgi:fumarate hydratase class II